METNYHSYGHAYGTNFWVFEGCPKYRYKIFRKIYYKNLYTICLMEAAKRHQIAFYELNVQPDHIHGVATLPRTMSISRAEQLLKGFASYLFFRLAPEMRLRYPKGHLVSPGKFDTTVGFTDLDTQIAYVRNQDVHHATAWSRGSPACERSEQVARRATL